MENELLTQIREALMKGKSEIVKELVKSCLERRISATEIMNGGLVSAMAVIGDKFKNDDIFIPEVMIAARAMNAGLEVLDPILTETGVPPKGKILLGTVRDDLHDVGKNMVNMMFRGAGYSVIDLGINVPEAKFVEGIKEHRPEIVGLSALLSLTLPRMKSTIEAIEEEGLREGLVIMVGGAPVTITYAEEIGADGWAPDAASAVTQAAQLLSTQT